MNTVKGKTTGPNAIKLGNNVKKTMVIYFPPKIRRKKFRNSALGEK